MKCIVVIGFLLAGCSSNSAKAVDAANPDGAGTDTPGAALAVTSTGFTEGGTIPVVDTCSGANISPPLAWTGTPRGTQSFAVVLTDLSITLTHWVIYDIPATATGLPASVENAYAPSNVARAHQTVSAAGSTIGYVGPCPSRPPPVHIYQFAAYALDTAMLPGVSAQSTPQAAIAEIQAHRLGSGALTGTYGF